MVKAVSYLRTIKAVGFQLTVRAKVVKTNTVIAIALNRTVRAKGKKDEPI